MTATASRETSSEIMVMAMAGHLRTDHHRSDDADDEGERYGFSALRLGFRLPLGRDADGLGDRQEKSQRCTGEWVHVLGAAGRASGWGLMNLLAGLYVPIDDMVNEMPRNQSNDSDSHGQIPSRSVEHFSHFKRFSDRPLAIPRRP